MTINQPTLNAHVTVAAIIERDGKFLMVEEISDGYKVLNQPAGHVEYGESFTEAIIRETLEETGWQFIPEYIVGIYRWIYPFNDETYFRHCFFGRVANHDAQRELDEGILQALWLSKKELLQRADELRSPLVMRCIQDYMSGQRFALDLYADMT